MKNILNSAFLLASAIAPATQNVPQSPNASTVDTSTLLASNTMTLDDWTEWWASKYGLLASDQAQQSDFFKYGVKYQNIFNGRWQKGTPLQDITHIIEKLHQHDPLKNPFMILDKELRSFVDKHPTWNTNLGVGELPASSINELKASLESYLQLPSTIDAVVQSATYLTPQNKISSYVTFLNDKIDDLPTAYKSLLMQWKGNSNSIFHFYNSLPSSLLTDDTAIANTLNDEMYKHLDLTTFSGMINLDLNTAEQTFLATLNSDVSAILKGRIDAVRVAGTQNMTDDINRFISNQNNLNITSVINNFFPIKLGVFNSNMNDMLNNFKSDLGVLAQNLVDHISISSFQKFSAGQAPHITDVLRDAFVTLPTGDATAVGKSPLTWFSTKYNVSNDTLDKILHASVMPGGAGIAKISFTTNVVTGGSPFTSPTKDVPIQASLDDMIAELQAKSDSDSLGRLRDVTDTNVIDSRLLATFDVIAHQKATWNKDLKSLSNLTYDAQKTNILTPINTWPVGGLGEIINKYIGILPGLQLDSAATVWSKGPKTKDSTGQLYDTALLTLRFHDNSGETRTATLKINNIQIIDTNVTQSAFDSITKTFNSGKIAIDGEALMKTNTSSTTSYPFSKHFTNITQLINSGVIDNELFTNSMANQHLDLTINLGVPMATVADVKYTVSDALGQVVFTQDVTLPVLWMTNEKREATAKINDLTKSVAKNISDARDGNLVDDKVADQFSDLLNNLAVTYLQKVDTAVQVSAPSTIAHDFATRVNHDVQIGWKFVNSRSGQEVIQKLFPDGNFDLQNSEFQRYLSTFLKVLSDPHFKNIDLSNFTIEDLENINKMSDSALSRWLVSTNVNSAMLKIGVGLASMFGLTGLGLGASSVATVAANRRMSRRATAPTNVRGIRKILSLQAIATVTSLGIAVSLFVYIFVVRGGF